ncbi:Cysteine and histidine-rich protein 1 [Papilio machaon]|uniref:Cysteine and histidine-rich protein 1 n=1 Tax=Papilio machaon TaxID=76193 RepID=A0A194QXX2_PAPMA|nr:Cysteine and histidine-rich protein 1 [Papilio machaon]
MTDITDNDPMSSSSENKDSDMKDDAPLAKKRKMVPENEQCEKLEHRLCGILCCAVCLELPPAAVYQCTNGHLMCAPCFTHLLADARLRDEAATCPNCRVAISASSASRNLAVEKTVSELPSECRYCARLYPRHALRNHEENLCNERVTGCKYACIGCTWRGPAHEARGHEAGCEHPARSAADLVALLAERERRAQKPRPGRPHAERPARHHVPGAAAVQHSTVQCSTAQYSAAQHSTVRYNACPRRQLLLKSKAGSALGVQWMCARGPWGEARMSAHVATHTFREEAPDSPPLPLPLAEPRDANRLLAARPLHCR